MTAGQHLMFALHHAGSLPGAYLTGGSVPALWGWLIVAVFNFAVVLSMAELSSAYPLAGGPYFWYYCLWERSCSSSAWTGCIVNVRASDVGTAT